MKRASLLRKTNQCESYFTVERALGIIGPGAKKLLEPDWWK